MTDKDRIDVGVLKLLFDAITGSNQLETMANRLTQLVVGTLGIKGAAIFMVNPEFDALELLASSGLSINYINKGPVLVDKSIKLASNREAVVVSDVSKSDRLQYPENAKAEGIQSIVSLPITLHGVIVGALRLYDSSPWEVSEHDLEYLQVLAQNLGNYHDVFPAGERASGRQGHGGYHPFRLAATDLLTARIYNKMMGGFQAALAFLE